MNSGATIILAGLFLFCGLAAATIAWTAPAIEGKLAAEAVKALRQSNLTFADVQADGRDLIVTGEAPNIRKREEARTIVATTWGNRVVWDRMTLAPTQTPEQARASEAQRKLSACQNAVSTMLSERQFKFEFGSARLSATSAPLLEDIVGALAQCPQARFEVEGHTDSEGPTSVNQRLSKNRAQAVLRALAVRGLSERRMEAIGYGSSRPIADNGTREGRARNRRIELKILRKD